MDENGEKRKTTEYAVVDRSRCDAIAKKYNWDQAEEPRRNGSKILPWTCTFEGEVEFPNKSEADDE